MGTKPLGSGAVDYDVVVAPKGWYRPPGGGCHQLGTKPLGSGANQTRSKNIPLFVVRSEFKSVSLAKKLLDFSLVCTNVQSMKTSDLITIDPDVLGGVPVFKGTRVPVKSLFDYLEKDYSLEEFLECFPSITKEMACRILERSEAALLAA